MFKHIHRVVAALAAAVFSQQTNTAPPPKRIALTDPFKRGSLNAERNPIVRSRKDAHRLGRFQIGVIYCQGKGYKQVPCPAPFGYFWKQDMAGPRWRLYAQ